MGPAFGPLTSPLAAGGRQMLTLVIVGGLFALLVYQPKIFAGLAVVAVVGVAATVLWFEKESREYKQEQAKQAAAEEAARPGLERQQLMTEYERTGYLLTTIERLRTMSGPEARLLAEELELRWARNRLDDQEGIISNAVRASSEPLIRKWVTPESVDLRRLRVSKGLEELRGRLNHLEFVFEQMGCTLTDTEIACPVRDSKYQAEQIVARVQ